MTKNGTLVEVKNLKKYFNTKRGLLHAVDDVSFRITKGETLGLVGESGCGKSTLGRVMIRLLDATAGEVHFDGEDILKYSPGNQRLMRQRPGSRCVGRIRKSPRSAAPSC